MNGISHEQLSRGQRGQITSISQTDVARNIEKIQKFVMLTFRPGRNTTSTHWIEAMT